MKTLKERCFELKQSRQFQLFVAIIIIYSSLAIGVNTYDVNPITAQILLISDYLITIIFLIELCIRFAAEKSVKDFFSDGWNIFDTIIVISSLIPSSASESILILRILRLLRLLRIVSFIPELRSMVENLFRSLAKSIYILILIFLITYIYAVLGVQFFSEIEGSQFSSLGESLLTLAQVATMSGWETVMATATNIYPAAWIYFVSYIFIVGIVVLNLFIAILVDVVNKRSN